MEDIGTSGKGGKLSNHDDMDMDSDDDFMDEDVGGLVDLREDDLKTFCRKAAMLFFNEYGLISHQINSYNDFVRVGIQKVFDSFGAMVVEPGFDPSKKGETEWRYASVSFGKVTLDQPSVWVGADKNESKFLPRHARLQNMTYSSRMKIDVTVEVYIPEMVSTDKFQTGQDKVLRKEVVSKETREITIGSIPVMVKSDL